jgi:class 3 adenylate cyclase
VAVRVRHLHQRTRPFRYGGFWLLAVAHALVVRPLVAGEARSAGQIAVAVLFCALWPWAADRLRALGPVGEAVRFDMLAYTAECALVAGLLAWASAPPLACFAAVLCLLAGATALAGWPLLLAGALALALGGAAGAAASPRLTAASTTASDVVALVLVLGFALALAHVSFRQAQRLDGHRRALAEKSAVLERINGRLQRYLPPSLRARVARAPDEPCRWERRWLTVAFVDLVGFTELSERLEAELLAGILDEYLATLVPAAELRGGEVSKLLGDGMLVVFGLRDGGDRHSRVEAALAFCEALPGLLACLAARWRGRGEPVLLEMRAGIASGYCTLGDRGGADRLDFTLIGSPVNLASRLQSRADAGGVLLDEASAALAEGTRSLGPPRVLQVKGMGALHAYPLARRPAS